MLRLLRSRLFNRRRRASALGLLLILLTAAPLCAALPEFYAPDPDGEVLALAVDANGRALVAGDFGRIGDAQRRGIARLHANGEADLDFDPGKGANGRVLAVAVSADGSVWIGGEFSAVNGQPRAHIARLDAQGQLLSGVGVTAAPNGSVHALLVQADGSVVIGGAFTRVSGVVRGRLARLRSDGVLDPDFAAGIGADARIRALAPAADGRLWVGGELDRFDDQPSPRVALLDSAGRAIALPGQATLQGAVYALRVDREQRLLVGGQFTTQAQGGLRALLRLGADGRLEPGFDPQVLGGTGVHALALDDEQRILFAGAFDSVVGAARGGFARLLPDGSLDTDFAPDALDIRGARALLRQSDGGLLVGGDFTQVGGALQRGLVRYDEQGLRERPLPNSAFFNGIAYGLAVDTQKRLRVAGGFNLANNETRRSLARWSRYGALDPAFGLTSGLTQQNNAFAVAYSQWLDFDGTALLAGEFTLVGGQARGGLARLGAESNLLPPFASVSGTSVPEVLGFSRDAQGRWLIHGRFTAVNGTPRPSLARLLADGSLDTGFAPAGGNALQITAARALSSGRVLVAGQFSEFNGQPRRGLAMLEADGSLAAGFDVPGGVVGSVDLILEQDDGRLLLGGAFSEFGGHPRRNLVRLLPDGQFDPGFRSDAGPDGRVISAVQQADGGLIIGGAFRTVQGAVQIGVARLLPDGSRDPDFATPGLDVTGTPSVSALVLEDHAHLLASAIDASFGGAVRSGLARIALREPARYRWSLTGGGRRLCWAAEGSAPRLLGTRFEHSADGVSWTALGPGQREGSQWCIDAAEALDDQWLRVTGEYLGGHAASSNSLLQRMWRAPTRTMLFADGFEMGVVR
jgi:uncharacterized delta-60 repeat protein